MICRIINDKRINNTWMTTLAPNSKRAVCTRRVLSGGPRIKTYANSANAGDRRHGHHPHHHHHHHHGYRAATFIPMPMPSLFCRTNCRTNGYRTKFVEPFSAGAWEWISQPTYPSQRSPPCLPTGAWRQNAAFNVSLAEFKTYISIVF